MDKRFQVFVSSTFEDLQDERREVMQALLELNCMPAGMELFPAANEDQWTLIKKVIDDCDYYLVIVGGRYGSIGPQGLSFTEMEYRYAVDRGKPVIAFLHKDPGKLPSDRCEQLPEARECLTKFRDLTQKKLVRFWNTPADLGSVVSRSIINLISNNPAVGWVRGDALADEQSIKEILRLKHRLEELESEIEAARHSAPPGTENLAQGDDQITVRYKFQAGDYRERLVYNDKDDTLTWNIIFGRLSPLMMVEARESFLKTEIDNLIEERARPRSRDHKDIKGKPLGNFLVLNEDFHTILVQFRALGLITKSEKSRSVKDRGIYWTLTPFGETVMMKLRAIRKSAEAMLAVLLGSQ